MTRSVHEELRLHEGAAMRSEVLAGLNARPKRLPSKYFYDATGSRLFEAICRTPEYYVTRTETRLLNDLAGEVARLTGPGWVMIEPGSGSSEKAQLLFDALRPIAYVPVDICAHALDRAAEHVSARYPWLPVVPYCGDFEEGVVDGLPRGRRLVFFPGSTIGNFEPRDAVHFLARLGRMAGQGGALLIGVDLRKEAAVLNAAYNDVAGITAAFNLNLLARLNRELDAEFDLDGFSHRAFFAADRSRVEMHLVSRRTQRVRVGNEVIEFAANETIHTENSYKYTIEQFRDLAAQAGWSPVNAWADPNHLFSVQYFVQEGEETGGTDVPRRR